MYYRNQTLINKETRELARLADQDESSQWAWDLGDRTFFINEAGKVFPDHNNKYSAIYDWLDRPLGDNPRNDDYVATHLRKYTLASDAMRDEMKEQYLLDWECILLGKMEEEGDVNSPFADGSKSILFKKFFLKRRGAVPTYLHYYPFNAEKSPSDCYACQIFPWKDKIWAHNIRIGSLFSLEKEYLRKYVNTITKWLK